MRSLLSRLREHPVRVAAAGDLIVLLLLLLALFAELAGDFETTVLGLRISLKSTWRILAWAAAVGIVRHVIVPRPAMLDRIWDVRAPEVAEAGLELARPGTRVRTVVAVVVAYTAVTVILLLPQALRMDGVPDHGDPLFSVWRLAWVAHQLPRDPLRVYDANIFYPHTLTLAFSDAMLVPAAAVAPLFWLGVHQLVVYNIALFAAIVLSATTACFLVYRLTGSLSAGWIAGMLFGFSLFRFLHYSHFELQVAHWMPLALLAFHDLVRTQRTRFGVWAGVAIALQALSSLYYGIFFVLFLCVVAIALWMVGSIRLKGVYKPLLLGAAISAAIVIPLTAPYWQNRARVGERPATAVAHYSAVPADFLAAPLRSRYYGYGTRAENGERELFPGLLPVILAAVALWPPLTRMRFAYGIGLVFAVDAALGLNGEVYHWLYDYVPGVRGLRVPARFGIIVSLALSILAGFGVCRIVQALRRQLRFAFVGVCAIAIAFESMPALALEDVWRQPPSIYGALPTDRPVVLAELPFPETEGGLWEEGRYMYFSTFHWHKLVNGNSGFFPPDYHDLRDKMQRFPSGDSIAALRARGVEYVVVHEAFYHPARYQRVAEALRDMSELSLVRQDRWGEHSVLLYRLNPARHPDGAN